MFSIEEKVRYSHIDADKLLTYHQIAGFFQDCTLCHSEAIDMGFRYLEEINKAWLLASWQIVIKRRPQFDEKLTVRTWAHNFKKMYGYRCFDMLDEAGECIAFANSIWIYLNTQTMLPIKASEEEIAAYNVEDKLYMDFAPRKINVSGEGIIKEAIRIRKDDIDTNNHVNNTKYIAYAEEYLPEKFDVGQIRVDYKKAAIYGEHLVPTVYNEEDKTIVVLSDLDGKCNVIVEFLRK